MLTLLAIATLGLVQEDRPGFTDTPIIPGTNWHVHDKNRPYPPIKAPVKWDGKPVKAPKGAIFPTWTNKTWAQPDGTMRVGRGPNFTKEALGSGRYHVEWRTPIDNNKDQGSGNSGFYLQSRYEVQILNCYGNKTYADGGAGAIYGQTPPKYNVCRPQGEWQTYDITFDSPVFGKDGKLVKPGYVTVIHNGVKIQDHTKIMGTSEYRVIAVYTAHAPKAPVKLQDHGSPVEYRNIWYVKR
ncbi:MAG: DUF1080 domain-containing protein [Armatimonadetes bacterium]|nr:DUF1080 domain-containing protein [Armatimonadota bacterium]